nr:hypothetical protein [Tanacetum cinerariifolium]
MPVLQIVVSENQKHQDHPSGKLLEMEFPKMLELDINSCPNVSIPLCMSPLNYLHGNSSILNGCLISWVRRGSKLIVCWWVLNRIVVKQVLDMVVDEPLESFDILSKSLTCKSILPPWKQARKIYYWDLTSGIRASGEHLKKRIYRSELKPFLTNSKEKPNLISLSKMSDHEDETITKENAHPKVVPQITIVTNISAKFPYLKKGDAKSMTTDNDGNLKIGPPVTAEEHQQVQREEKARTILLSALPDEHMGDFYHVIDGRDIWNAIKARFEEGLDKGYDKMQKILTQMNTLKIKPEPEDVNMKFLRGLPPSWSDADSEGEVVFANDAIPAGDSVFAGNVAAAAVSPQSETEFTLMGLSTEDNSLRLEKAKDRDSLLPTIFWTEAVATACYVLNRVLMTKPHDKTPYELLIEDKPSISYLKPFGYHVTILNTSDPLGNFDKKSDEGTGQAWIFDIDYLTDSLNYSRVSSTNLTAGSQGKTPSNVGSQEDDSNSDDEPDVLIIQSTPTPVVPIVGEATTQNDGIKFELAKTNTDNLDELAELQALQRQEQAGTKEADRLGLEFPSLNPILGVGSASIGSFISAGSTPLVSAGSTPPMSPYASPISADRHSISAGKSHVSTGRPTGSTGRPVSAGRPSSFVARIPVPAGRILGKFTASASSKRFPRASSVENPDIHDGLKIFDCPKSGIFTSSSYDEEFSGPDANNLESSLDVSSTITKRIHNIYPTSQVLGDINFPVQTRSQVKHKGSSESAFISYIHDQRRNNHIDFQLWTKWILKNKRDARGIVCRNKARLVAQGHVQEEGIYYTDVFEPVARIKAIRLFLAFASFMGFMVYQMDVKSAFLYGKIAEEGYKLIKDQMGSSFIKRRLQVDQRPDGIFIHQEKYVADILKKFDLDNSKLASTPFEPQNTREKNVPDEPISVHLYRSMIECLMYLTATRPDILFAVCAASRHQVTPKTSNLLSVKRIFKYLTAYPKLGLWYPRDSPFDLEAFSDSNYAGANGDRISTTGGCQFLGRRLISWQCKKQTIVATSSCEAEYVAAASCCGQWFLFTSAGRVTFCWLFPIPAGDLVSAGHMLFLLGSASKVSLPDGVKGLVATIDGTAYTITEASIRSALQLDDLNA